MSILVDEYNKINNHTGNQKHFTQVINVSLLDILSESVISVDLKDYKECLCKDSVNRHHYFSECDKCHGSGVLNINGHDLVCNECHGEKYVRIHDCYVCHNENKILMDSKKEIQLTKDLKENDEIVLDYPDYKLILNVHIYDLKDFVIEGNDIYMLKSIRYSKEDYKNKVSKAIKVIGSIEYVKSEFKKKKEIRKLEHRGINNGDFYFIFDNEVDNEKEVVYTNVLISHSGYVSAEKLINDKIVVTTSTAPINSDCIYLDGIKDEVEVDDYLIKLNFLNAQLFEYNGKDLSYVLNLSKEDLSSDKKMVTIRDENINVSFKKNLKETMYFNANAKVVLDKNGKKADLLIKINPYFNNVYKISIKKNKSEVYIEDYKYKDYRLVNSFKRSDYLDNYIKVKDEDKVYLDDNVILIKRV